MEGLLHDLRHALRALRKSPGFTTVAVLTLALGIGATTAIFSVVDAVLVRPLPYVEPERVLALWQNDTEAGPERAEVSPANFLDWRERSRVFEEMAAIEPWGFDLLGAGEPETLPTWLVTRGFFEILGARALHGRTFLPEEFEPGSARVVLLGHGFWKRRFGSDPRVVGTTLTLDRAPHSIVGILPPGFQFPEEREFWAPRVLTEEDREDRGGSRLQVVGRLARGVTLGRARAELAAIASQLAAEYPRENEGVGVTAVPLPEQVVGSVRPALLVLLGAVGILLLIACVNVSNLLLARAAEREREYAVRAAVGAGKGRLIRQSFLESGLLAFLGGVAGVLVADWGIDLLLGLAPASVPRLDEVGLDLRVLAFTLAASLVTAFVFGLAPAFQSSRPDLKGALHDSGRSAAGSTRRRLRSRLIVVEVSLAFMLLIGAGLLARSFVGLVRVDPGFVKRDALALQVFLWDRYETEERRAAFMEETLERIEGLPGVESAGAVSALPFIEASIDINLPFTIEGRPAPAPGQEPAAYASVATPGYFRALGTRLVEGRFFTPLDRGDAPPVALVNETMARRHWPDEDPIGKKVVFDLGGGAPREIVGVVGSVRHGGLETEPRPEIFVPHLQFPFGSMTFVVRTSSDPLGFAPAVKEQIWASDRTLPIYDMATLDQLVSGSLDERRFHLLLLVAFAAAALLLAAVGIYGLVSYLVSERTSEIGVRIALGARSGDILRLVLGQGVTLTVAGLILGFAGASALAGVLRSMLYGVAPRDPLTFAAAPAVLLAVGLLACYIPARRATRVDPITALRRG